MQHYRVFISGKLLYMFRVVSPLIFRSTHNRIYSIWYLLTVIARARLKRDGTRAETRFGLSEKWTSPFKSEGESVQSTAGSRGLRISGDTMDRPCSEAQCKSSGYTLQSPISPSLPLPRVTVCHHVSNSLYRPSSLTYSAVLYYRQLHIQSTKKGKSHPCTGTETPYRPYGP